MQFPFLGPEAVRSGHLTRGQLRWNYRAVHPGVYVPNGTQPSVPVNASAAWLWSGRRGIIVREERIGADEVMSLGGLAVTTPVRTALDLGRHLPRDAAVAHLDALARATGVTTEHVLELAAKYLGARGIQLARESLALMDRGAQSPRETRLRLMLIDDGLPPPRTQARISDGFTEVFIDMGYDEPKVGLDYEGSHHHSERGQYVRDIGRAEFINSQGWIDIKVFAEHGRAFILHRVRAALTTRSWFPRSA